MSTKCSLAWGEKFHAYTDCLDNHAFVCVQLDGAEFEASPSAVTVQIPLPIWEHIRAYSPAQYHLADLTDKKLCQLAKKRAAKGKQMLRQFAAKPNSLHRALLAFRQTASAREILRQLKATRQAQQKLRAKVERFRKTQQDARTKIR